MIEKRSSSGLSYLVNDFLITARRRNQAFHRHLHSPELILRLPALHRRPRFHSSLSMEHNRGGLRIEQRPNGLHEAPPLRATIQVHAIDVRQAGPSLRVQTKTDLGLLRAHTRSVRISTKQNDGGSTGGGAGPTKDTVIVQNQACLDVIGALVQCYSVLAGPQAL